MYIFFIHRQSIPVSIHHRWQPASTCSVTRNIESNRRTLTCDLVDHKHVLAAVDLSGAEYMDQYLSILYIG